MCLCVYHVMFAVDVSRLRSISMAPINANVMLSVVLLGMHVEFGLPSIDNGLDLYNAIVSAAQGEGNTARIQR